MSSLLVHETETVVSAWARNGEEACWNAGPLTHPDHDPDTNAHGTATMVRLRKTQGLDPVSYKIRSDKIR